MLPWLLGPYNDKGVVRSTWVQLEERHNDTSGKRVYTPRKGGTPMTSLLMKPRQNTAARVGLALATINAGVSLAWWIRHGTGWVGSSDLLAFPGPWQWPAAIALLAVASGASLGLGRKNAANGYSDDAKVFGGVLLTVIAVVPLLIQGLRYLLFAVLFLVGLAVLFSLFSKRRR